MDDAHCAQSTCLGPETLQGKSSLLPSLTPRKISSFNQLHWPSRVAAWQGEDSRQAKPSHHQNKLLKPPLYYTHVYRFQ